MRLPNRPGRPKKIEREAAKTGTSRKKKPSASDMFKLDDSSSDEEEVIFFDFL